MPRIGRVTGRIVGGSNARADANSKAQIHIAFSRFSRGPLSKTTHFVIGMQVYTPEQRETRYATYIRTYTYVIIWIDM